MTDRNLDKKATVYVLGAGASNAMMPSAPLMAQLLPEALKLFDEHPLYSRGLWGERVQRIKDFLKDFYNLNRNSLPNLEDMLTLLDDAITEDRPISRNYSLLLLRKLREDLVYTICETLRQKLDYGSELNYNLMEGFINLLDSDNNDASILSLNYDIIIDNALLRNIHDGPINYGLPVRYNLLRNREGHRNEVAPIIYNPRPQQKVTPHHLQKLNLLPLYKIHGSLNWLFCPSCQQLDVTIGVKGVQFIYADGTNFGCPVCHGRYDPLIITPTLLKEYKNMILREIWRQAEDKISQADNIVFIGYSLPEADAQLRCMLSRALFKNKIRRNEQGDSSRCNIQVVGKRPREENEAYKRYVALFGKVEYYSNGFQGYIENP